MMTGSNAPRGIAFMVAAGAFVTVNDSIVKLVTVSLPVGEILFLRGLFALFGTLLLARRFGGTAAMFVVHDRKGMAFRVAAVVASNFLFVTSVKLLPLADAVAIGFAGPLFLTLLAVPFLGERVGWRRGLATLVGFMGVVLMVRPTGDVFLWATLLPVTNALVGAGRDLMTRKISATDSSISMLCWATVAVAASGLLTLPFGWVWPTALQWGQMAVCAGGLAVGQYMMIEAFRWAEASLVAPFKYTTMAWAVLAGFLLWGYLPDAWLLSGVTLVIASGLYIWHREGRRR